MMATSSFLPCSVTPELQAAVLHEQTYPTSRSYKVTAQDGDHYVMKVFPPAVAQELSYKEVFANQIGIRVGFSMARWRVMQLDDQTLKEYLSRNQLQASQMNLSTGSYFSTRVMDKTGQLRLYLGSSLVQANSEVAQQLGCMRMLDFWLAHASTCHYAAVIEKERPVHVYFFGNSQIISPESSVCIEKRAADAYKAACRITGNVNAVNDLLEVICNLTTSDLREAIRAVPAIWRNSRLEAQTVQTLESRRDWIRARWRAGARVWTPSLFLPVTHLCETSRMKHAQHQAKTI